MLDCLTKECRTFFWERFDLGQVFQGSASFMKEGEGLVEGDVLGCLFCRSTGRIIFFLNGVPSWSVVFPDIILNEAQLDCAGTHPQTRVPMASRKNDMFVTIGVLGKGEIEVNFGGKNFQLSGEIRNLTRGEIETDALIGSRSFGRRLAAFNTMLDELRLFYAFFCPPMESKAKATVVLNVSRREEFESELKASYGKDLSDVRNVTQEILKRKLTNFLRQYDPVRLGDVDYIFEACGKESCSLEDFLKRTYGVGLQKVTLRRKASIERMLHEYFDVKKIKKDVVKLEAAAEQAVVKPMLVDSFLRDKYGAGINVLLRVRLFSYGDQGDAF